MVLKKYSIRLPVFMVDAPQWWQNFAGNAHTKILRDRGLNEHGARFITHRKPNSYTKYSIEFNSSEEATLFVLKWT